MEAVYTNAPLIVNAGVGIALVIISALHLGSQSYSSLTQPSASNVLFRRGIYRYQCNPSTQDLLIVSLAIFLSRPTLVVGIAYLFLALVTNVRAGIEENLLEYRYQEFAE